MNLGLILESLKFYKIKHAKSIQIWFVLLYALNLPVYVFMAGNVSIEQYVTSLSDLLASSQFTLEALAALKPPDSMWLLIGLSLLAGLINGFFSLLYATLFLGELNEMTPRQSLNSCLTALPRLALFGLLIAVPAVLSSFLAFLPLIIFAVMMYFLPLLLSLEKLKLGDAIQGSLNATRGHKLFIFSQVVLVLLITGLPQNLILNFVPIGILPTGIVTSFFNVLRALIMGRLMGMLYLMIVKKVAMVTPAKPEVKE